MVLMFKLVIGAEAVGSAIPIAASERNTEPIKAMIEAGIRRTLPGHGATTLTNMADERRGAG